LKLIESIAAGRVCVSTADGARGFAESGFSSLLIRDRIEDFCDPLERLLLDPQWRISIEKPDRDRLQQYSWADSAFKLAAVYRELLAAAPQSTTRDFL
jgi:glycosyltransferase involved in cell wall biosynthesis